MGGKRLFIEVVGYCTIIRFVEGYFIVSFIKYQVQVLFTFLSNILAYFSKETDNLNACVGSFCLKI
jgi:hypothetical protein